VHNLGTHNFERMTSKRIAHIGRLTAFVAGILLFSCSKNPLCVGEDINLGLIKKSFSAKEMALINEPRSDRNTFIITNEEDYHNLVLDSLANPEEELPEIDFRHFTLLGQCIEGNGCDIHLVREVTENAALGRYEYNVTMRECGECDIHFFSMNWVLVPTLPKDYYVTFRSAFK